MNNVGAALTNVDGRVTTNTSNIATNTSNIASNTSAISNLANGTTGLVQQNATTRNITVGAATDGTQVSIAGTAGTRTLTGVSAGTVSSTSVDAVNGSQLYNASASVASAVGGGAAVQPNGTISAPSYAVGGTTVNSVGAAISNVDGRTTQNTTDIAGNTSAITSLANGTAGLVQQNATTRNITVGAATDGAQVSIAGTAGSRLLTGVAAGTVSAASVDAINGSQLHGTASSLASALGGGSAVNPNGTVSAPTYAVGGTTVNSVGAAITNVDGRTTQNTTDIAGNTTAISSLSSAINNGTTGLVQQDAATRNLTVGAATDGTQISIAGTGGNRVLTGVAPGAVSATSVDAVNGSQLHGTANSVASALGGGSVVNPDGTLSAPSYSVGGTTVGSVGAAVTNLDGRTTTNTGNIAQNTTDIAGNTTAINNLSTAIGNGTTGLVQQDVTTRNITVGATTDGSQVNFAGTGGSRVLTGVAAGAVNATSVDAVNGSQLHGTATSVANALGGGAAVNADGTLGAPSYTVGGTTVNTVAGAVGNLDGRVTQNSTDIAANTTAISGLANGTVGLVQQDAATRNITVGAATDGTGVNFAGTAGNRVLTGVAAGSVSATSVDAINGSQLHASVNSMAVVLGGGAVVGPNGALIPPSYTVGGTTVNNVGAAVSNLDGRVTTINSSITNITNQINNSGLGMVQQAPGSSTISVGANPGGTTVDMTGTDGSRVVTGVANGSIGQNSTDAVNGGQIYTMQQQLGQINASTTALATDTAAPNAATVKPATNGVAVGNGATVQANNSAAVGANSVADRPNTVSVGSAGNERVIANVADPVIDTDAVNQRTLNNAVQSTNNYIDQRVNQLQNAMGETNRKAYSGVAAATALTMIPEVDPGRTFAIGIGASTYQGYGATAIGVSVRVNERVKIKAGAGLSSAGATTGVSASFQW